MLCFVSCRIGDLRRSALKYLPANTRAATRKETKGRFQVNPSCDLSTTDKHILSNKDNAKCALAQCNERVHTSSFILSVVLFQAVLGVEHSSGVQRLNGQVLE